MKNLQSYEDFLLEAVSPSIENEDFKKKLAKINLASNIINFNLIVKQENLTSLKREDQIRTLIKNTRLNN